MNVIHLVDGRLVVQNARGTTVAAFIPAGTKYADAHNGVVGYVKSNTARVPLARMFGADCAKSATPI